MTRPCTHKRADVGFERLSGHRMLDQSITGFDPKRTDLSSGMLLAGEKRQQSVLINSRLPWR